MPASQESRTSGSGSSSQSSTNSSSVTTTQSSVSSGPIQTEGVPAFRRFFNVFGRGAFSDSKETYGIVLGWAKLRHSRERHEPEHGRSAEI